MEYTEAEVKEIVEEIMGYFLDDGLKREWGILIVLSLSFTGSARLRFTNFPSCTAMRTFFPSQMTRGMERMESYRFDVNTFIAI